MNNIISMAIIFLLIILISGCATTTQIPISQPCVPQHHQTLGHLPIYDLNDSSTYSQGSEACIQSIKICQAYAEYTGGGDA